MRLSEHGVIAMDRVETDVIQSKLFKQRYRPRKNLASGGLANTYLADDLLFQRAVIVNVIYPDLASKPGYIQRLEAESRMAAALEHPNIARTLDWGYEDGIYFVVNEYVEGRSLKDILRAEGKLPPERAARIASQVCSVLQLAHSRNLVHGGLSPENIMIDEIGDVKVLDLGLAWAASGRGITQYVSPEQVQRLTVDGRSDIYSLGIILYQMLVGRVPFDDPDIRTIAYKQVNEMPVSPTAFEPSIPSTLNAIVMKAQAKNARLRFQNAKEMDDALLLFLAGTAPASEAAFAEKRERMNPRVWALIAAVALLAIAVIVLALLLARGNEVTVSNVIGMTESEAADVVQQAGLNFQAEDTYITGENQQEGTVVEQNPAAGAKLDKGASVTAKVSRTLRMPDVMGQSQADAENTLRNMGIDSIEQTTLLVADPAQDGKVVGETPSANTLITPDTIVTLQIGKQQPNQVIVPNVVELDQNTAIQQLQTAGLKVSVVQQQSQTVPQGRVISQSPAAGQRVTNGSTVVIVVSQPASSGTPGPPPGPTSTP